MLTIRPTKVLLTNLRPRSFLTNTIRWRLQAVLWQLRYFITITDEIKTFHFNKFISLLSSYLITLISHLYSTILFDFLPFSNLSEENKAPPTTYVLACHALWTFATDVNYTYITQTTFLAWLFFLDCLTLQMKALRFFKALGTAQHHKTLNMSKL